VTRDIAAAAAVHAERSDWQGGTQPFGISSAKMGMWLFIMSDALTFAALLFGYGFLRRASRDWPQPFALWPAIGIATVMTFCLLGSGLAMGLAVFAARRGDRSRTGRWLLLTLCGGLAFLLLHLEEWRNLAHAGVGLRSNPWGEPLFGATFFTLTGAHLLHVLAGLIYAAIVARRFAGGHANAESVEICGLYWAFVELVWLFVFPMVYLLSIGH